LTVDLTGDVAFETADDLAFRHALFRAAFEVETCPGIAAQAGYDDAVEGGVGLPVSSAVQPATLGLSGGLLDGALSRCWVWGCLTVCRGVVESGSGCVLTARWAGRRLR
jgi:hypothetical protein